MRVLVTGAAGFIGGHTAEALLRRGTPVLGLDNFDPYYEVALKRDNVQQIENTAKLSSTSFTMVEGDICDEQLVAQLLDEYGVGAIIHLAAKAGVRSSLRQPLAYVRTNVEGTVTLLEAARQAGVRRFIFASSSSVYGDCEEESFTEDYPVSQPISPYAVSKVAGENFCYVYHMVYNLPVLCLRLFTVYGPRQRPDLAISKFVRLMRNDEPIPKYGDGTSVRDYTFIGDIVRGILAALDCNLGWGIINLGGGSPITLNDLIDTLEGLLGKRVKVEQLPPQPGDMRRTHASITKARDVLHWAPEVPLRRGLQEFIARLKQ